MKDFMDHIVASIDESSLSEMGEMCYVFPSKRAGVFFLEKLRERFPDKTFWSPQVMGVEDFVCHCAGKYPADDISMVFGLYEIYKQFDPGIEFEKFYAWGQILLSDFDEVDRNLVDSDRLYKDLGKLANLEEAFGDNEELKEAYEQFAELFEDDHGSALMQKFKSNWEVVAKAYDELSRWSEANETYYSGQIFRMLTAQLEDPNYSVPFQKVTMAGFNALSASEESIFRQLIDRGDGEIYWDCDVLYMRDDLEEAGDFLRSYRKTWPKEGVYWIETDMAQEKRTIQTIGCPQLVSQAKYAGKIIEDHSLELGPRTAVVLGDENLLMPVVHSMSAGRINVTMGYPFRFTSLYGFISQLFLLHAESQDAGSNVFRSQSMLSLLKNTLVNPIFSKDVKTLSRWIRREKLKWVKAEDVMEKCGDPAFRGLFSSQGKPLELLDKLSDFLVRLFYYLQDGEHDSSNEEIVYQGLKFLNRFRENLEKLPMDPGIKFVQLSFQESARSWKIPFSGEPLEGLQVMGFLESRALDFDNVIVLGANENRIPRSSFGNTYIPFVARKAFGLPTFQEHEAIYAYHFKRILQRAKNVFVLYDTEVAVDGSGEKSRFLLQLERKLSGASALSIEDRIVHLPFKSLQTSTSAIEVAKDDRVLEALERYKHNGETAGSRLSPTKLANYIDCSLRFYFREIARIPEDDPSMDEIDPRMFGIVLHSALEKIYEPFVGKEISFEELESLHDHNHVRNHVEEAMKEFNVVHASYGLSGKDLLLGSVLVRLVKKIIERDQQDAPLTILGVEDLLEGSFELDGGAISLGGNVDRIDQVQKRGETITRIIDYKTGRVEMLPRYRAQASDPEEYFEPYFDEGKYKSGFQAYYYAYLYHLQYPTAQLKAGIYELKRASRGTEFLRKGDILSSELLGVYGNRLKQLIQEVFDPTVPFKQTEDLSKCRYCAYKTICQRND